MIDTPYSPQQQRKRRAPYVHLAASQVPWSHSRSRHLQLRYAASIHAHRCLPSIPVHTCRARGSRLLTRPHSCLYRPEWSFSGDMVTPYLPQTAQALRHSPYPLWMCDSLAYLLRHQSGIQLHITTWTKGAVLVYRATAVGLRKRHFYGF
jgi:hypothetical protein